VTATINGKTVATGTLDANGHATLTFAADVPRGATILVTAGSVSATIVLAQSDDGTLYVTPGAGGGKFAAQIWSN